jgi:hypothetical protein
MAAPTLSSSDPSDGAVDAFLNRNIELSFGAALTSSSVTQNSVVLLDVATNDIVATNLSYDASTFKITVSPLSVLAENTVYKVRLPGTDIAISSNFVLKDSATSDPILTTITVTFTTGEKVYIDDTSIDKDATDLSLEGDLTLPIHVKALGNLAIESTYPKNFSCDQPTTLDGNNRLYVKFNKALSGELGSFDWINVDAFPILDDTQYLASGSSFGEGIVPDMTGLIVSGNYLFASFETELPKNVGVDITISTGVTAQDGSEYGPSEYVFSFTTDRYPKIGGIHSIKTEIKAATDELNDNYVCSLLLKNTVELIERYPTLNYSSPNFSCHKYVTNKTIVDILDDKELEKALVAGSRRQLGDLNVSVDAIIGKFAVKHKRAEQRIEEADRTLQGKKYLAKKITNAVESTYYTRPDRQWHGVHGRLENTKWKTYQGNFPASNIGITRAAKVPPGTDWL